MAVEHHVPLKELHFQLRGPEEYAGQALEGNKGEYAPEFE